MSDIWEARTMVNENGRVVIPASFRRALGIRTGDELVLRIEDDELRLAALSRHIQRAQQLVRKHVKRGTSLVDELIAERRHAAERLASLGGTMTELRPIPRRRLRPQ